jgi:hypothetical protein
MSTNRPFDHDTLKIRAIFVPENNPNRLSAADARSELGADPLKIPAIFVPEGSGAARPGHPYVHVGKYVMDKDQANEDGGGEQGRDGQQGGSRADGQNQDSEDGDDADAEEQAELPMPPTPALATSPGYADPVAAGTAVLRGIANPNAVLRSVAGSSGAASAAQPTPAVMRIAPAGQDLGEPHIELSDVSRAATAAAQDGEGE